MTALAEAESLYQAKGVPARIQTFDLIAPPGLDGVLRARGYQATGNTLAMINRIETQTAPADTERYDRAVPQWREVYLGAITGNRRSINTLILDTIPGPRTFFACRLAGRVISPSKRGRQRRRLIYLACRLSRRTPQPSRCTNGWGLSRKRATGFGCGPKPDRTCTLRPSALSGRRTATGNAPCRPAWTCRTGN